MAASLDGGFERLRPIAGVYREGLSTVRPALFALMLWIAAVSRCDEPRPPEPAPVPGPGGFVRVRGSLAEDVDCRLLRAEGGRTYSLSSRLRNLANGTKVCIHGTLAEASPCMTAPMIEVQSVRPWSACP